MREITNYEFLYTANLALLCGAKLISPWLFIGDMNPDNNTSLINNISLSPPPYIDEKTAKYYTLKDTIAPRLSGLMGKTLKKLKPVKQFAGSNGIDALIYPQELTSPYEYIKSI